MKTKVVYNLFKQAIGVPQIYRPTFEWFSREEIISGKNKRWQELLKINPSLGPASKEFTITFYNNKMKQFQKRYNLDEEKIKEFFKVYVGYHPNFGLYLCSIGPYVGEKIEDKMNRFGYFTHKLASLDADSLRKFLNSFMSKNNKSLSGISKELTGGNKSELQKFRNSKTKAWEGGFSKIGLWNYLDETDFYISTANSLGEHMGDIDINKEFLENSDLELLKMKGAQEAYMPVIGTENTLRLKPKGALKLIMAYAEKRGRAGILETQEMIEDLAYNEGMDIDDLQENLINNEEFIVKVCEEYSNKNPLFKGIFETKSFGTKIPDALVAPKPMINGLKLKEEILSIILTNKTTDTGQIASILNSTRKGDVFNEENVQNIISEIEGIYSNNYNDALQKLRKDLIQAQEVRGFDNFESALKMASVRLAEEEVDPFTKAKLRNPKNVFKDLFEKTEGVPNYTDKDLTKLRSGESLEEKEGIIDENIENGNESIDEFEDIQINKSPVKSKPVNVPENTEEENTEEKEEDEDILANKLNQLIRISNNLKKSGNITLANKLNTLIRKYQS